MKALRTGIVAMLLAFVCSIGLVTQTATPAAALIDVDLGKIGKQGLQLGSKIAGSEGVKGASLFARVANPYGLAVTAGMAAWWAYDNRDAIMDFVGGTGTPKTLDEWCQKAEAAGSESCAPSAGNATNWKSVAEDSLISGMMRVEGARTLVVESSCLFMEPISNPAGYFRCTGTGTSMGVGSNGLSPDIHDVACRAASGIVTVRNIQVSALFGRVSASGFARAVHRQTVCLDGETIMGARLAPSTAVGLQRFGLQVGTYPGDVSMPTGPLTFQEADVTVRCKNSATGETAVLKSKSDLGDSGTVVLPSCKQRLGEDWFGTGITVAPAKPEVEGEPLEEEDWDVPDFPPWEWDELIPKEDVQPCHGSKNGCSLSVWIDNDPCSIGVAKCKTWTKIAEKTPTRVECQYGTRTVPMRNCYPLAHAYDTRPDTQTNVDTDAPPTVPETGVKTPTDTVPEVANPAPPTAAPTPPPVDVSDAPKQAECFPKGWGVFNPFEWVYKPVKCALIWAFQPTTSIAVRIDRMKAQFTGRAPFSWAASLGSLSGSISGGGCPSSWAFDYKGREYSLICGTPAEGVIRAARPIMLALTMGAAAYPLIRSLVYASTPVVKPTPT